jgi:hypothetical protein
MENVRISNHVVTISKTEEEKRIVKGIVYKPNVLDSQGDWMAPEDIEKSAHSFMKNMRIKNVDTKHTLETVDAFVCESYITKADDPDGYPEGSWVVAMKIEDETLWEDVKKGEYEAFSMWGQAVAYKGVEPPTAE